MIICGGIKMLRVGWRDEATDGIRPRKGNEELRI